MAYHLFIWHAEKKIMLLQEQASLLLCIKIELRSRQENNKIRFSVYCTCRCSTLFCAVIKFLTGMSIIVDEHAVPINISSHFELYITACPSQLKRHTAVA